MRAREFRLPNINSRALTGALRTPNITTA